MSIYISICFFLSFLNFAFSVVAHLWSHPSHQPVSHVTTQPTLITSPPPKGSYFLIARPSCSGIPEINSPPLCYSYYLGVLELAWPSKQTLYSAFFFFFSSQPSLRPYQWSYITAGHGTCPRAAEVNNGQRYRAVCLTSKALRDDEAMQMCSSRLLAVAWPSFLCVCMWGYVQVLEVPRW